MMQMSSNTKYRILFIDDEDANLRVFKSAFKWDYDIITAPSASEAKEILDREPIDLILTDQRMPDVTGVEFLESIIPDFPDIPRIIITGYSDVESIIEAVNKGQIFQYITKPWNKQEVQIVIEKALGESQLKSKNKNLITSLKESNTQLKSALKELDNFIYKASHDLMSPITSVLGLVNLTKMDVSEEERLDYINKIESTAKKMKYFLSHMALVNIVNDKTIEVKEVSIGSFVNKYDSYSTKNFKIQIDRNAEVNCLTDDVLLNIALSQIVENSLKFIHPDKPGEAWIKVSNTGSEVLITIKDNGIGINQKYTEQYFGMFFKGENSEGSGVGLFIARKVVEKLQGKIWMTGGVNEGTTVHILLPERMIDVSSGENFFESSIKTMAV